jgi:hypothetical protein
MNLRRIVTRLASFLTGLLTHKRVGGGGYETIVVVLLLILVAPIYIVLNYAMSGVNLFSNTIWSSGYYDNDTNTFVNEWWLWIPGTIFFISMLWLFVRYQRRDLSES